MLFSVPSHRAPTSLTHQNWSTTIYLDLYWMNRRIPCLPWSDASPAEWKSYRHRLRRHETKWLALLCTLSPPPPGCRRHRLRLYRQWPPRRTVSNRLSSLFRWPLSMCCRAGNRRHPCLGFAAWWWPFLLLFPRKNAPLSMCRRPAGASRRCRVSPRCHPWAFWWPALERPSGTPTHILRRILGGHHRRCCRGYRLERILASLMLSHTNPVRLFPVRWPPDSMPAI